MKKIIVIIISVVVCIFPIHAQDIHFSQYYANPLNLNPALTGYMAGDQRLNINYRNQWARIINPYKTLSVSYDQHFFRKKMTRSWFGGGIQILSDQAGTSKLSNNKIALEEKSFSRLPLTEPPTSSQNAKEQPS